jgi:hypothetical protein
MGKVGAHSSILLLTAPLTFNLYVLILITLSFFISIGELGGLSFSIGIMGIGMLVLIYLEYVYVSNERYKIIVILNPNINRVVGVIYFILSNILFSIIAISLLSE